MRNAEVYSSAQSINLELQDVNADRPAILWCDRFAPKEETPTRRSANWKDKPV